MKVEQFVMAYRVEQDRIRAMLPEGYESLRPVLRINAEIRVQNQIGSKTGKTEQIYIEFNTPVAAFGKRGWLNIAHWETPADDISYQRSGKAVSFRCPFLEITYKSVGIEGGCPAEKDNDGCFFISETTEFVSAERIDANREFCDCEFEWKFAAGNACGVSIGGKSVAALPTKPEKHYDKQKISAEIAAAVECEQILGAYTVKFER